MPLPSVHHQNVFPIFVLLKFYVITRKITGPNICYFDLIFKINEGDRAKINAFFYIFFCKISQNHGSWEITASLFRSLISDFCPPSA